MPRATTYTPSMAETVATHLANGRSLAALSRETGIGLRTLFDWRTRHSDFAAACATKPQDSSEPVAVTLRPAGAVIFSLAAWGLPRDLAHAQPPARIMTEDDVDALLWERTSVRAA